MRPLKFNPLRSSYGWDHACTKCGAQPTVIHSSLCETHYLERHARMSPSAKRGAQRRRELYPQMYLIPTADSLYRLQRARAHAAVARAVQRGVLPRLDGSVLCADCGGRARHYDHRDYRRQLEVQPVCGSCNRKRGVALWGAEMELIDQQQAA